MPVWSNLDEKQIITKIEKLREEKFTWEDVAQAFNYHNPATIFRWYRRRVPRYDAQKSLRDFDKRLRMLEESLVRSYVPPPPPPGKPLPADTNGKIKSMGTQLHSMDILQELKQMSSAFIKLKAESKDW